VLHHLRAIAGLENVLGRGESPLHVALPQRAGGVDVAVRRVDPRRAVGERLQRIEHRRQRLVLHLDRFQRSGRDVLGYRSHCGDAVAGVMHALGGEHRLVLQRGAESVHGDFLTRQHGHDPGQAFRRPSVDAADPGRGNARPLDARMEHVREREVFDIARLAQPVQAGVGSRHALSDRGRLLANVRDERLQRKGGRWHERGRAQKRLGLAHDARRGGTLLRFRSHLTLASPAVGNAAGAGGPSPLGAADARLCAAALTASIILL
jgi:hypothetical protein